MTKQEQHNYRSLKFSNWIRNNLPDSSTGFCVTDLDWILWNFKQKKLMLLEEKNQMADIAPWFRNLVKDVIHPALSKYCSKHDIDYRGFHLIQFGIDAETDCKIYLDRKEISEEDLIQFLSML